MRMDLNDSHERSCTSSNPDDGESWYSSDGDEQVLDDRYLLPDPYYDDEQELDDGYWSEDEDGWTSFDEENA